MSANGTPEVPVPPPPSARILKRVAFVTAPQTYSPDNPTSQLNNARRTALDRLAAAAYMHDTACTGVYSAYISISYTPDGKLIVLAEGTSASLTDTGRNPE